MSDDLTLFEEIFDNSPISFLATVCEQERPHVRPMVCRMLEDGRFWSATFRDSNKVKQIAANPRVELCLMDNRMRHARVSGTARIIDGAEERQSLWELSEQLHQYFKGPDDPRFVIVEIAPTEISWMAEADSAYHRIEFRR